MTRKDCVLFLVPAALAWVYVLLRAAFVPMVHDECASVLWYVRGGEWLPWQAHWDAGNHYLSTGIGLLVTHLAGESPFALRIGSMLAYLLYAWSAWRVGTHVDRALPRRCLWAALLLCPFLLDFFSLFRGYGIEMAGWLFAVDGLLRYASTSHTRHLAQALGGLLLGGASIVALVPAWGLMLLLLMACWWAGRGRTSPGGRWAQGLVWLGGGVLPLAWAAQVAFALKERGLLYHGSIEGFFTVTVRSLCRYVLGNDTVFLGLFIALLVLVSGAIGVRAALRNRVWTNPALLVNALLFGDVLARILMARALGVNYPEDRAALHLVPLALLSFALAAEQLGIRRSGLSWAPVLLLVLPLRSVVGANVDHTLAWPQQSIPERFMAKTQDLADKAGQELVVGGQHQLALAWPMNAGWLRHTVPPIQCPGFPEGPHDLRLVDARYLSEALIGYHAIDSAMGPGLWLLERDRPFRPEQAFVERAPERSTREEFDDLAHVPDSLLRTGPVQVTVQLPLSLPLPSADVRLVLEVNDAAGEKLFYDAVPPLALAPSWRGERLRWAWRLPTLPDARRAVLYLHNPAGVIVSHGVARTEVVTFQE